MNFTKIVGIILFLSFTLSSFTTVMAVEDQFEIDLTVTGTADTTAPSTPAGLLAATVSSSQIDLSWVASTDNIAVTGYRVYRDNTFVTTVSGVTHSDTGLSAATSYAYTVSAIDAALNESARSATSSATTFTAPATNNGGGGGGSGQFTYPVIYDIEVLPGEKDALIKWKTTEPTIGTIAWGISSSLELGVVSETSYNVFHQATLGNLLPGTQYLFSIEALNGYGLRSKFTDQRFTTNSLIEYGVNARNFTATAETDSILLSWNSPISALFDEVRVVRGEGFYPSSPEDGTTIYEGKAENFRDTDVLIGKRYYYALFAKDTRGSYSSGLLASARIRIIGEPIVPEPPIFEELPKPPGVHPAIELLSFLDFDFIQDGKRVSTFSGKSVAIDGAKNLTVSLSYSKVPEILKSIVITLRHPTDPAKIFSFLLRVNDGKTAYVATIGPLGDSGTYGVDISIVDYKNQGLKKIVGNLFASAAVAYKDAQGFFSAFTVIMFDSVFYALLLLIVLFILLKAFRLIFKKNHQSLR